MGAFIIFDVGFKAERDRILFEKYLRKNRIQFKILVSEATKSFGFAWTVLRNPVLNPIYYVGFLGYAEPEEILEECLKNKIKITFFAWLPINDKNTSWEKLRGRWPK